ncbi:Flp pilus assembly protein CpaB [Phenylobacterium sp.]|uniref:Flp pilus assembly protein CpaB n=1 Tax=Phenylobacterium sp. TaxID=1871053 RepID=UPI00374DBDED
MRVVTIVSLGACALFGLGALVVAKTMMPSSAAVAKVAPAVGVPVVVAKSTLKFGDRLEAGKLDILKLPANAVPDGAFSTVAQVLAQDHGGAPVALTQIASREPILPAKLSGPGARASIAAEISDGMRAYTIKVTDVTGVGGHALPGDRVDVVLMRDLTPEGQSRSFVSEVVTQNIRVLGVDLNEDPASNKPATPSTATLEVSVPDAQKLAVAADLGKLSLALRKSGSVEVAQTAPMHTANFVGGGRPPAPRNRAPIRRFSGPALAGPPAEPKMIVVVEAGSGAAHKPRMPKAAPAAPAAPAALPEPTASPSSSSKPA